MAPGMGGRHGGGARDEDTTGWFLPSVHAYLYNVVCTRSTRRGPQRRTRCRCVWYTRFLNEWWIFPSAGPPGYLIRTLLLAAAASHSRGARAHFARQHAQASVSLERTRTRTHHSASGRPSTDCAHGCALTRQCHRPVASPNARLHITPTLADAPPPPGPTPSLSDACRDRGRPCPCPCRRPCPCPCRRRRGRRRRLRSSASTASRRPPRAARSCPPPPP